MRALKVYATGVCTGPDGHQWHMFAAVNSMAEFARLLRTTYAQIKNFTSETGNARDCAIALARPHVLFGNHSIGTWYTTIREPQEIKWREEGK